jgi:hypothetical protein
LLQKGKALCDKTTSCFGVAYHGSWTQTHKGVKLCESKTLQSNSDWNVVLKEAAANTFEMKYDKSICKDRTD